MSVRDGGGDGDGDVDSGSGNFFFKWFLDTIKYESLDNESNLFNQPIDMWFWPVLSVVKHSNHK